MIFHNSSPLFFVFLCFLLFFAAVDGLGWCGDGPDVVGNGWEGLRVTGGVFSQVLRLIGRKSIKTMKIDSTIDAVDPQAAADNHPPPPGHNG